MDLELVLSWIGNLLISHPCLIANRHRDTFSKWKILVVIPLFVVFVGQDYYCFVRTFHNSNRVGRGSEHFDLFRGTST